MRAKEWSMEDANISVGIPKRSCEKAPGGLWV
jgi:hypothetical protein